ncbi:unnamed protein product [Sphagnum troendelagicum]|uniref:Uncharacterized protein n=1 Tax=Sphagnum troendelagicum TaxID=128251 RepID=A0ABP0UR34_9BRYO
MVNGSIDELKSNGKKRTVTLAHPSIVKVAVVIHTLLPVEFELSVDITLQQCHQPISDEREQRLSYYQEEIKDSHNSSFVGSVSGQDMKNLWDMGSVEREEMPKSPMHFCIAM